MNDTTANPLPTDDASGQPPTVTPQADENPLDALEQILQQAKAKSGGSGASASEEAEKQQQLEEQQKKEEQEKFIALQEQKRLEDAQALAQQITNLKSVEEMPQYQARMQQEEAEEAQAKQTAADGDGYEIEQLEHTKV